MAVIVFVHGIVQEQGAADTLESEWLTALAGGIRTAGYAVIVDRIWRERAIDVRMAFYGHYYLTPGQQGGDPGACCRMAVLTFLTQHIVDLSPIDAHYIVGAQLFWPFCNRLPGDLDEDEAVIAEHLARQWLLLAAHAAAVAAVTYPVVFSKTAVWEMTGSTTPFAGVEEL